jgi:hypothetical protein
MRHVNQEAVKRMRTGSNFGASPSSVVGPVSTNMGDRNGAPRPRHCASFPPFTFCSTRFERSSQDGSSIESLFTLPSERSLNLQIENSNSRIRNQMGGILTGARVEGSSSMNLVNFNVSRVKRSLSDNGIQIEGSSHLSPTQKSHNTSLLNPNLTKVRRSLSQEQNEIEGIYTLSSMDMLPVANPDSSTVDIRPADMNTENSNTRCTNTNTDSSNPYMSRFRILSRSRSQMEGALSMSPMDKRLFLETALANATNAAYAKAYEIDKNKSEGMASASSIERSTDGSTANHDANKGGRIISQNEIQINGMFSRSSAEKSSETNSASCNESEGDRTFSKGQDQMESTVSLSSLERLPGMTKPNSNEKDGRMLENQAEMDATLSLSSKMSSSAKLARHEEESTVGIELSLSSVERSHSTKGVAKSLPQGHGEMEGVLSLSSRDKSADASASKPDSHSEMASILTLASTDGSTDRELEKPYTIREKSSSLNDVRIEASLSLSATEISCDTNLEKANANGAEKSLVLQPGLMKEGSTTERSSPEMNSANRMLLDKDDDRTHSMENQGQIGSGLSISQMEKLPDSNPITEHQGRREGLQRLPSVERSEANLREPNLSQMESTSVSSIEGLSNTALVKSESNAQQHQEILLVCFIF